MSTLTQFLNSLRSATAIQSFERGALAPATATSSVTSSTPNAWTSVLTLNSPGILFYSLVRQADTVSKTVGIRVLINGAIVSDRTRAVASAVANNGVVAGAVTDPVSSTGLLSGGFAPFKTLEI